MEIKIDACYNCDCKELMQAMREQNIKADWCITDPPYGIDYTKQLIGTENTQYGNSATAKRDYSKKSWDNVRIGGGYFDLMRECSNNQILFGGNYYTDILPPTKSWLVWNKRSYKSNDRNDFADCELAWCSKGVARVINYLYNGMIQNDMKNKDYRFHPTQKPTQLWYEILKLYTKEDDLILDPFAGSQSLRIACHKLKRRYIGAELDKEYYEKGCKWFERETAQMSIFDFGIE